MTTRTISQIIEPQFALEGAGVLLRRSIAPRTSNKYDPFLLFDHFAFNDPVEGPIRGFPMHPHRGIETVTYMLEGSVNHRDSLGNAGLIGAGDVQWMTSGRGIMHEEMPRRGPSGNIYGFQLGQPARRTKDGKAALPGNLRRDDPIRDKGRRDRPRRGR
jgi:redox-sensitive bicupin YhaK (pirin superfamily)